MIRHDMTWDERTKIVCLADNSEKIVGFGRYFQESNQHSYFYQCCFSALFLSATFSSVHASLDTPLGLASELSVSLAICGLAC